MSFTKKFDEDWVKKIITEECVDFMEAFGLYLCDKKNKNDRYPGYNAVTTAQMRNIFSEVKRIDVKSSSQDKFNEMLSDVALLKPKIAYATARVISSKRDSRMTDLREVLEKGLGAVQGNVENFRRFSQIFEGFIAYHKVYGGKD